MLGPVLRRLIDEGATSVRAIEDATGRGESTVYRWLAGRTRPDVEDLYAMLRNLNNRAVRQELLGALTSDLPVNIAWSELSLEDRPTLSADEALQQALDQSVHALRGISDVLAEERELAARGSVAPDECLQLASKIDEVIHHLTESRVALCMPTTRRRKAT